jgi:hypothetical protein
LTTARLAALLLATLALLLAGCGNDNEKESGAQPPATTPSQDSGGEQGETDEEKEKEEQEAKKAGGKDCDEIGDLDAQAKKQPPSDVKIVKGAHVYDSQGPFGKTTQYFAAVDGDAEELPEKRDDAVKALKAAGYKLLATDQEAGAEAEAHMKGGKHTVDVQVITLCAGKLRIRYTVS